MLAKRYPRIYIISCCKSLLIFITQAILGSDQMIYVNDGQLIDVCKGNDVDMHWKVDEGNDQISRLDWYFNGTNICNSYPIDNFTVSTTYQGRIERINRTGIRLKNVSLDDEGIYVLFPVYQWSKSEKMTISIQVLEPPTKDCFHMNALTPESYCGRPTVSFVLKRNQGSEVLGKGNWSMNSTLQDEKRLFCLDGEAMKCVADSRHFCTIVSFLHQDDERSSDDGKKQTTDSVTVPAFRDRHHGSFDLYYVQKLTLVNLILTSILIFLTVLLVSKNVFVSAIKYSKKKKRFIEIIKNMWWYRNQKKLHVAVKSKKTTDQKFGSEKEISMNEPMIVSETEIKCQKEQIIHLDPVPEKVDMLSDHQHSLCLKTMKEIQKLHPTDLCMICSVNGMSVVFMPCGHILTCTYCCIALKNCPFCRLIIEMKMSFAL